MDDDDLNSSIDNYVRIKVVITSPDSLVLLLKILLLLFVISP